MILADGRHRLSREDAQLAVRLLARDSAGELDAVQQRLVDEGLDAILDDQRLPGALLGSRFGALLRRNCDTMIEFCRGMVSAGAMHASENAGRNCGHDGPHGAASFAPTALPVGRGYAV